MEQYVLVGEFDSQQAASRACSLLEDRDVPVMVEHARQAGDAGPQALFRVLVPIERSQTALRALSGLTAHVHGPAGLPEDRQPLF